jgi:hypothetical protein
LEVALSNCIPNAGSQTDQNGQEVGDNNGQVDGSDESRVLVSWKKRGGVVLVCAATTQEMTGDEEEEEEGAALGQRRCDAID